MVKDITGEKYSMLTAIRIVGKNKENRMIWEFLCDCGNKTTAFKNQVEHGNKKCCGCKTKEFSSQKNTTHGKRNHPLYATWNSMMDRCYNEKNSEYKNYGNRGIFVCKDWHDINKFIQDMGEKPSYKFSLERKNVDGGYELSNCVWATAKEQGNNKRNTVMVEFEGLKQPLTYVAEKLGLKRSTFYMRLRRGFTEQEAIYGKRTEK